MTVTAIQIVPVTFEEILNEAQALDPEMMGRALERAQLRKLAGQVDIQPAQTSEAGSGLRASPAGEDAAPDSEDAEHTDIPQGSDPETP